MTAQPLDTDWLIDQVIRGDVAARQQLLARHRDRLRRMVAVRLDRRVAVRVDPSDVVQETLAAADRKMPEYLRERPLPFYPWLRTIALERVSKIHEQHLRALRRSVTREQPRLECLPDESALTLARMLIDSGPSPSRQLVQEEMRAQVQAALARLREQDREILVMRYLEQLSNKEIAAAIGVSEGAVKMRHLRALTSLRSFLGDELEGDPS
jgi:RNA polymerase sigma-70 factor, ECF subfamily